MTQEQLAHTLLPLGKLTKAQVRELAAMQNFVNAKKDESQDICFVPDGDYGSFMETYSGKQYPAGNIIDLEGNVIGRHKGIVRYTLGQRRGLGVACNEPVYVAAKSMADNTVTLGPDRSLYTKTLTARGVNLIACEKLDKPIRIKARTRYLQKEQWATADQSGDDELRLTFDEGQRAVTPGQAVVMYDGDVVVGGGTIYSSNEK
jgi:tRNA-specific 2-thiouridylase